MKKHLVLYVEDSSPKRKIFKSKKSMYAFVKEFELKYLGKVGDGYWVDYIIEDIRGDIVYDE